MSSLENFLRGQIRGIVLTEEEKEKPSRRGRIKKGSVGKGGVKKKIKEAGALASENPKELMKRLGVKGAPGGANDYDKIANLVRSAIFGNDVMSAAYGGARITEIEKGDKVVKVIEVTARKITPRDGTLYMLHTLTGADNAGYLTGVTSSIEVSNEQGRIVVILE